jgi:hypothetical protein
MTTHRATVKDLKSWVQNGGVWRIVDISGEHVTVDLCTCTGERMDRVGSADPEVIDYVRKAPSEPDGDA